MLKKKEWLRQWKNRMLASGEFDLWELNGLIQNADFDWKCELSPNKSADEHIRFAEELENADKSGG